MYNFPIHLIVGYCFSCDCHFYRADEGGRMQRIKFKQVLYRVKRLQPPEKCAWHEAKTFEMAKIWFTVFILHQLFWVFTKMFHTNTLTEMYTDRERESEKPHLLSSIALNIFVWMNNNNERNHHKRRIKSL